MPCETLLHQVEANVATITLNRPQSLNALNAQLLGELSELFTGFILDPEVRVIVITGAGEKAFAAGADIRELAQTDASSGEQLARRVQSIFREIHTSTKPVIAAINGFALGGGCELALACTLRLAADTAKLGQPEIKLGVLPGWGGSQLLPRLIGHSAALKMMLTGEMITAAEALRLGLVDEVLPAAELLPRAQTLAAAIAAQAPLAVAACIEAVRFGAERPLLDALALEAEIFGRLCGTDDKREGTAAFLEKRKPVWVGR
ncbi:enoyl-CoA hydratase [Granulicella rosea]|uniref:Enoyl-CoA hydratase n=1 Tax=Granulicella rosea TaxID=474952 RepID=A0A239L1E3_9BACT|nr:enoyl-CoA hydratase-related protein [Granulicella rosea]SNT23812.1 enoyl-CoA hydratase [Granulicella rosea]